MDTPHVTRTDRGAAHRGMLRRTRTRGESGQGALALVLGISLLLATGAGILASSAIQHDPLVQNDVVQHDAYRALEAGVNSYLNTINAHPNLVNCSNEPATSCAGSTGISYGQTWTQVAGTDKPGSVPEYYLWTNPQLCFSSSATANTKCTDDLTTGNLEYVKVLIIGAAGIGDKYVYQSTVANFAPTNGFLTHVWWSNYESEDPALYNASSTACTYDWNNSYNGPGGPCQPVYFGPGDVLYGPVFTNDSVYVSGGPKFGGMVNGKDQPSPVTSGDNACLFVGTPNGHADCDDSAVSEYDPVNSKHGQQFRQPIPPTASTDSQLQAIAAQGGCVYSGPTLLSFFVQGDTAYMNVISPDTPTSEKENYGDHLQVSATVNDGGNDSTNTNVCMPSTWGGAVKAPTTANGGNGVIHVTNASGSSCEANANPYNPAGGPSANAQVSSTYGYNYTDDIVANPQNPDYDCEGDAFVRNAHNLSSGQTAGIRGGLTVATTNNVVITGDLTYTDCQAPSGQAFDHKADAPCQYNPPATDGVNDALGLIADNYVEVNHPVTPDCSTSSGGSGYGYNYGGGGGYGGGGYGGGGYGGGGGGGGQTTCGDHPDSLLPHCTSSTTDVAAALCDPASPDPANPGSYKLTVDAAILALNHSFAVNNNDIGDPEGELVIYGSVAQDWRGAVGTFSTDRYGRTTIASGYSKYYTWDNRLEYVSIPYYLSPGTPSWALASSAVVLGATCPQMPPAFHSGGTSTACPPIS